jgi:hypothetical protein
MSHTEHFIKGADGRLYRVMATGIEIASDGSTLAEQETRALSSELRDNSFGAMAHAFSF